MSVKKQYVPEVGRKMYEKMRAEMEANHWGKMVVIEMENYEIEADRSTVHEYVARILALMEQ